jgi:hypothetical protein
MPVTRADPVVAGGCVPRVGRVGPGRYDESLQCGPKPQRPDIAGTSACEYLWIFWRRFRLTAAAFPARKSQCAGRRLARVPATRAVSEDGAAFGIREVGWSVSGASVKCLQIPAPRGRCVRESSRRGSPSFWAWCIAEEKSGDVDQREPRGGTHSTCWPHRTSSRRSARRGSAFLAFVSPSIAAEVKDGAIVPTPTSSAAVRIARSDLDTGGGGLGRPKLLRHLVSRMEVDSGRSILWTRVDR